MDTKKCSECKQYIQHYAYLEGRFQPVYCGHCMEKSKKIKPHAKACDHFAACENMEKQFVTKRYLTKALLQHILTMDLWEDG